MRIYIIGNDGITLCREAPAAVNDGEIAVASLNPGGEEHRSYRHHRPPRMHTIKARLSTTCEQS
jgi:hypothetical protein